MHNKCIKVHKIHFFHGFMHYFCILFIVIGITQKGGTFNAKMG
nr:MAG TPA: hypothetical protein [Caudoviricetes sp.]